jgi:transcriptional regulator with XRE-family HTH domain
MMKHAQASAEDPGTLDHTFELRVVLTDNIRHRAQQLGLRLNAVADLAGVSRSQFYNILRLNSSPSLDWLSKIAAVLQMPPAALLLRESTATTGAWMPTQPPPQPNHYYGHFAAPAPNYPMPQREAFGHLAPAPMPRWPNQESAPMPPVPLFPR